MSERVYRRIVFPSFVVGLALLAVTGCRGVNPRVETRLNDQATILGDLPGRPPGGRVITSWIDKANNGHPTMSTLYGNDVAVQFARSLAGHDYPAGSVISVVTWNQQEDERWFGGNIPAVPQSVEIVTVKSGSDNKMAYEYRRFEGSPLRSTASENGPAPGDRAAYLLAQRAAVMP
jgi:hypothetical protein